MQFNYPKTTEFLEDYLTLAPSFIKSIDSPTQKLQLIVIRQDSKYIQYINKTTFLVEAIVINRDIRNFFLIKNPTKLAQKKVLKINPLFIYYIDNPYYKIKDGKLVEIESDS